MIHGGKFKRMEVFHNIRGETPEAIKARTGCTTILSGVLFNPDGSLCCDIRIGGKWIANESGGFWGLGWSGDEIPQRVYSDFAGQYDNFISGVEITPTVRRGRAAIGFRGGSYTALCVADGSMAMTIPAVHTAMQTHSDAYLILDGGGSAYLDCPGGKVDTTLARKTQNRTYLLIWEREAEKKPEDGGKGKKKMKICLDPGHGLTELNRSPDGSYYEHEFALDMAKRVRTHLQRHGHEVLLTREDGSTPGLSERAAMANAWGADLFFSLHSNAVAINKTSDPDGDGHSDVAGLTAWIIARGGERERAAVLLLEEMKKAGVQLFGAQLYTANFWVLAKTIMPAVLIEYAFHTTKGDIVLLKNSTHRAKLAEATAKAIIAWCKDAWVPESGVPMPSDKGYYTVQSGAFVDESNAVALKKSMEAQGYKPFIKFVEDKKT